MGSHWSVKLLVAFRCSHRPSSWFSEVPLIDKSSHISFPKLSSIYYWSLQIRWLISVQSKTRTATWNTVVSFTAILKTLGRRIDRLEVLPTKISSVRCKNTFRNGTEHLIRPVELNSISECSTEPLLVTLWDVFSVWVWQAWVSARSSPLKQTLVWALVSSRIKWG